MVVAEGQMGLDGVFRVAVLASPSCESRAQLPATAQVSPFAIHTTLVADFSEGVLILLSFAPSQLPVATQVKHTQCGAC